MRFAESLFGFVKLHRHVALLLFKLFVRYLKPALHHRRFSYSHLVLLAVLRTEFQLRLRSRYLFRRTYSLLDLVLNSESNGRYRPFKVLFEACSERLELRQQSLDFSTQSRECFLRYQRLFFLVFGGTDRYRHRFSINDGISGACLIRNGLFD